MADGSVQRLMRRSNDIFHLESIFVDFECGHKTDLLGLSEIGILFNVNLHNLEDTGSGFHLH